MSYDNAIAIGPEFFAKAKNDYADWYWAVAREFGQNSIDCGSDTITVAIARTGSDTLLSVTNNGSPMTWDIMVGKLLSLGGTGKGFEGTVGGFGKAKEILYFCHKQYRITSGTLVVEGSGAGYNLTEQAVPYEGTTSEVWLAGDQVERLEAVFKRFAVFAQWSGTFTVNGEVLECGLRKGSPRRTYDWGTIYTNKTFENRVIVRIGGIPMFTEYTGLDRTVIIELSGTSAAVLTANRDGLVAQYRDAYQTFLSDLQVNKSRALKAETPRYQHFSGAKFAHREGAVVAERVSARELVGEESPRERVGVALVNLTRSLGNCGTVFSGSRVGVLAAATVTGSVAAEDASPPLSVLQEEFILKNETTLQVPDYYRPDTAAFGTYGRKLARIWGRLVLELHRLLKLEAEFSIGFVFSDDCEAQHELGWYGRVYYINPATVVEQASSRSKSFKKRFALTERDRLLAIAAHEVVHGLGLGDHNEDYATKLTEVFAVVMKNRKRFSWAFA